MTLPTSISPGDPGHIADHDEIGTLLGPASTASLGVAMIKQGVFASRPAPGNQGLYYYATDTGVTYYDTGAAWVGVLPPNGSITAAMRKFSGAEVHNNTGQSPADATWTQMSYNVSDYDTDSYQSGNYLVAPLTGYYLVTAGVTFNANATGWRGLGIRKNQSGTSGPNSRTNLIPAVSASHALSMEVTSTLKLTAADQIDIASYSDSGGTLNISNEAFEMTLVGT